MTVLINNCCCSSGRRIVGVDEADDDDKSILLCNSGIVLTARMSEPSAGDGDDKSEAELLGTDNILLLFVFR